MTQPSPAIAKPGTDVPAWAADRYQLETVATGHPDIVRLNLLDGGGNVIKTNASVDLDDLTDAVIDLIARHDAEGDPAHFRTAAAAAYLHARRLVIPDAGQDLASFFAYLAGIAVSLHNTVYAVATLLTGQALQSDAYAAASKAGYGAGIASSEAAHHFRSAAAAIAHVNEEQAKEDDQ